MTISPLVRIFYWLLFASCYGLSTFVVWKTVPYKSYEAEFLRACMYAFSPLISVVASVFLCRLAGITLRTQIESPLEVEVGEVAPACSELRTYPTQTMLRVLSGLFIGISVLTIAGEMYLRSRFTSHAPAPMLPTFLGLLSISGLFWLASYVGRRGNFVAGANEDGLEIQKLGERSKRIHLGWSQIASAVQVRESNVMGEQTRIEIRDDNGKVCHQILLGLAPKEQQQQFVRTVGHYLSI